MYKFSKKLNEEKLGPPEPYDPKNPEHNDPTKYKLYQGDVWHHTLAALRSNNVVNPLVNLSILLHDIGKPGTMTIRDHGGMAYFGHAEESMKLVDQIADRMKMSNKERETLLFAVGNHMRFHLILGMKPSKVAKIVNDDNWDVLVLVARADEFSRGTKFQTPEEFQQTVDMAIEIKEKWGSKTASKAIKIVDGNHVMDITGLKPGKQVGDIIKKTTDWIIDNGGKSDEEIDEYIRSLV